MKKEISTHIINKWNWQDGFNILSDKLSGSELNTVLLEVFDQRVQQENSASLLEKYDANKLVKPAEIDVLRSKEKELESYKLLANRGFEPIEFSPVTQMGASSVIATVNQKKVLTALRNTEVQADPTNAIALYYASLRKKDRKGIYHPIEREDSIMIQTPQGFHAGKLKKAYEQNYMEKFTDDATVYETAGNTLFFFQTEELNLKITTAGDVWLAEALIEMKK